MSERLGAGSIRFLVVLLGAVLAVTLARCSGGTDTPDAGTPVPDAGQVPADAGVDAGIEGDAGTDAGETDGGADELPVETTVPKINDLEHPDHPEVGARVAFTAVAAGPRFLIESGASGCLWGLFVADATAETAEHNGVLLTAKGTYDSGTQACNADSPLHVGEGEWQVGEAVEVVGRYEEYCSKRNPDQTCQERDASMKGISTPRVAVGKAADLTRTGDKPGLPDSLPAQLTFAEIGSSESKQSPYTYNLGAEFWKHRAVLVKVVSGEVTSHDSSCDFSMAWISDTQGPALRVSDAFFPSPECDYLPVVGKTIHSMIGFLQFENGKATLLPRSPQDSYPVLPALDPITLTAINDLTDTNHPRVGAKVSFKGMVISERIWEVSRDETAKSCTFGVFMLDWEAQQAGEARKANNGLLLTARVSMGENGVCSFGETPLWAWKEVGGLGRGDVYFVEGRYEELCDGMEPGSGDCPDTHGGKRLSNPTVRITNKDDLTPAGNVPYENWQIPVVAIDQIYSAGGPSGITALGTDWWTYRSVLVKVTDVKVVDDTLEGCDFAIEAVSGGPSLIVSNRVMNKVGDENPCPARPAVGTTFSSIAGFVHWTGHASRLAPRDEKDASPHLPGN